VNLPQLCKRPTIGILLLFMFALLGSCGSSINRLAPTPNLYLDGRNYNPEQVPIAQQTIAPQILYVTNRAQTDRRRSFAYAAERSDQMAFGTADVSFDGVDDWQDLIDITQGQKRGRSRLRVANYSEEIKFSTTPLATERAEGNLRVQEPVQAEYEALGEEFKAALAEQMRRQESGRVLLYIHGFNNQFDDALVTLANIWHYAGRRSVPMIFSWPAGNSGVFKYFKDREASNFSAFHLKETLDLIAEVPEVETIDIVAHSLGSDVTTVALRELIIRERAKGNKPKISLKTGTLILAAPDLDVGSVRQRLLTERFSEAFEQVSVYINPNDTALALSSLFTQVSRLGRFESDDFAPGEIERIMKVGLMHFILVEGAAGSGHSYFRQNPSVLSDIALTLRTRAFPGGQLRPLEVNDDHIWTLHHDYPLDRLPVLTPQELRDLR